MSRSPSPATSFLPSPLDVADRAFTALVTGPNPLSLDGREVGHGLPHRLIPLDELKCVLLHPSCSYAARQAAWAELVRRSRSGDPAWVVGATGVALPGLRRAAARLVREFPAAMRDGIDVDAEVLAGFLQALHGIDVTIGHLVARLCWAGYHTGRRRCRRELTESRHRVRLESLPPAPPDGHPDLLLLEAVDAGAITLGEARLIGVTRLEGVDMQVLAAEIGVDYGRVRKWRSRAERRLVEYLISGEVSVSHLEPKQGLEECGTSRAKRRRVAGRSSGADTPDPTSPRRR